MTHTTTHTPGPWAVNDKDTGMNDSGTIEGCGIVICPDVYGESRERTNANAHLIAAAPAMYEALSELLKYLREEVADEALDTWTPVFKAAIALTQAEGKQ